ncbi:MAG: hypothetical protein CMJ78_04080 [Planctomycetaceae bacterium]|nr:hypothetical protein [Planctomycetaceae bacterium]
MIVPPNRPALWQLMTSTQGAFDPPSKHRSDIPKPLEAICMKTVALLPDDRYQSALDLAVDIEKYLADEPIEVYRDPWKTRARRWVKKNQQLVTGSVAAPTGVVVLATAWFVNSWMHVNEFVIELKRQQRTPWLI